jgi:conjugative transfer region protein (TIGR03750 family)
MLNHINHKMPIYKDCTLGEVIVISSTSLFVLTFFFSILTKVVFGYFWPGYLLASALFFFVSKIMLSKLQKLKYGKPYGYYQHLLIKKLEQNGLLYSRYVTRIGRWSVRRPLV